MRSFLTVCLTLSFLPIAHAQEPVRAWQGNRTVVQSKHLVPVVKDGEGYGEKYTFDAKFGDRGSFYFSMAIANLGIGDKKMEAKGRLTLDGKVIRWKQKLAAGEWSFNASPLSIKAGSAELSGEPQELKFSVKAEGHVLTATMKAVAQPWRPRNGQVLFGKSRKATDFTIFPLGNVELTLTKPDGSAVTVTGIGYGARSWSEIAVYEQSRASLEFRGIDGDKTIYIREIMPSKEYSQKRVAYLLITKGDQILVESFDFELDVQDTYVDSEHPNQYRVPVSVNIMGQDAEDKARLVRGRLVKNKLRKRKDILASMNSIVRMVAKRYSQPVSYSYDTDYLFEVKLGDKVESLSGLGRYEFYHWKK
ncbi:MAG: hypothetical protein CMH52_13295 [Myxococcales bacterium]|nr:hypothetical protein [Myxococcales bacterium]